jgi:hypothetical protein
MKNTMLAAFVIVIILATATIATAANYVDDSQKGVNSFVGGVYGTKDSKGNTINYPLTYSNQVIDKNVSYGLQQTVQGNGYYMSYKYSKMGNTEFEDYAHGSGSLDSESILTSYNSSHQAHLWNDNWNDHYVNCIQYKETTHAVYAPTKIAVGTGYYATNPLNYDSLIKEKTWVKNRLSGSSIENEVEYAHKLDKDLSVVAKDFTDFTYDPIFTSNAFTQMKISEDVGEGKIHIGVLQASSDLVGTLPLTSLSTAPVINNGKPGTAWYKPALLVDEDYWGTYHVEKNMTLAVPYSRNKPTYDWLPCSCMTTPGGIGGWSDMFPTDQKAHSAKGFFDCTTCWPSKPCSS